MKKYAAGAVLFRAALIPLSSRSLVRSTLFVSFLRLWLWFRSFIKYVCVCLVLCCHCCCSALVLFFVPPLSLSLLPLSSWLVACWSFAVER